MPLIAPVEREDAHRVGDGRAGAFERPRPEVDERQRVHRGDARDPRQAVADLLERERWWWFAGWGTTSSRLEIVPCTPRSADRRHRSVGTGAVGEGDRRVRRHRAEVQPAAGEALCERALPGGVGDTRAVERRRVVDVAERRRWLVVHHDLVGDLVTVVDDAELDRGLATRPEPARAE